MGVPFHPGARGRYVPASVRPVGRRPAGAPFPRIRIRMPAIRTPSCCTLVLAVLALAALPASAQTKPSGLARLVDELLPEVEQLSGLTALAPLSISARSRDELRSFLRETAEREVVEGDYAQAQMAYRLLGLLPDTLDLEAFLPELMAEQIAGYYDFRTDTLYILDDVPPADVRGIVAHEMTHALQDQHFTLDELLRDADNDAGMAVRAAIEGHATLVMLFVQLEEITGEPVDFDDLPDFSRLPLEAMMPGRPSPVFADAPRLLRESGAFPYGRGLGFAHALRTRDPAAVPFATSLPLSTEQVMDPHGRFLDERDDPIRLLLEDTAGTAWTTTYENTLGQFELSVLLMERHRLQSESVADGWGGDRYRVLRNGDAYALEWFIAWDDARSASRFVTTYTQILRTRVGRSATVERLEVEGVPLVRIVETRDGVDLASLPRARVRLGGR